MKGAHTCEISPALLRELLDCDYATGSLIWRPRDEHLIPNDKGRTLWNARYAGKAALNANHSQGYKYGNFQGKPRFAHRIIWAHRYGEHPNGEIDHIDGDRANNAIDNLRCVSRTQNMRNMKVSDRNKSGIVGVYWSKGRQKWVANISLGRRTVYLGIFSDINDAARARQEAERRYGFHKNHGRAA